MKIKYESPELEIVKFSLKTNVVAASQVTTEDKLGGGEVEVPTNNPFPIP